MLLLVALSAHIATATSAPASIGQQLEPIITADDYPTEALRNGWQGDVTVELTITAEGRVRACTIIKSSGYSVLDRATCRVLRRRARFEPAKDSNGSPIESRYVPNPVRWRVSG